MLKKTKKDATKKYTQLEKCVSKLSETRRNNFKLTRIFYVIMTQRSKLHPMIHKIHHVVFRPPRRYQLIKLSESEASIAKCFVLRLTVDWAILGLTTFHNDPSKRLSALEHVSRFLRKYTKIMFSYVNAFFSKWDSTTFHGDDISLKCFWSV